MAIATVSLTAPLWHEFYLECHPDIYRVAIGELIEARLRDRFKPSPDDPEAKEKSGSVGFMDVTIEDRMVPPDSSRKLNYDDERNLANMTQRRVLVIAPIGVEDGYEGYGIGTMLLKRADELAIEWGLDTVVAYMISDKLIEDRSKFFKRQGFRIYTELGEHNGIKILKTQDAISTVMMN